MAKTAKTRSELRCQAKAHVLTEPNLIRPMPRVRLGLDWEHLGLWLRWVLKYQTAHVSQQLRWANRPGQGPGSPGKFMPGMVYRNGLT